MVEPNSVLVFCVRHGETSWNEAGLLQGQTDIPLNDRGRQQAQQAGVFLAQRHQLDSFAGYFSSDLSRALETAALIMAALPTGGSPQTDKRLRETHMGRWQGKTWEHVTTDPDERVASDKWRRDPDFPVPGEGGESFRVRFSRVAAATHAAALHAAAVATKALARSPAAGTTTFAKSSTSLHAASTPPASSARVLIVSHGGVLDDVARLVKKVPFGHGTATRKVNAALHILRFTPDWSKVHAACGSTQAELVADTSITSEAIARAVAAHFENPAVKVDPTLAADVLGRWELLEWGITEHLQEVTGGLHRSTALFQPPGAPGVDTDRAVAISAVGTGGAAAGGAGAEAHRGSQAGNAAIAEGDIAPCEPADAEAADATLVAAGATRADAFAAAESTAASGGAHPALQAPADSDVRTLPESRDEEEPDLESMQTPVASNFDTNVP